MNSISTISISCEPGDTSIASTHLKKVIDAMLTEYQTELQKIKDEVFHLVVSGNYPLARDTAEAGEPFQTAIATLRLLKTKLGFDKE